MGNRIAGTMREFGGGCPKCCAPAGVRSYCPRCKEVRGRVDHHHCACTSCGFAWTEKPADAPKEPAKKGGRR